MRRITIMNSKGPFFVGNVYVLPDGLSEAFSFFIVWKLNS